MEERFVAMPAEAPPGAPAIEAEGEAGPLSDPRTLQILATEHWALLAGRSLVYNEAFSRAGMFLSFLSATLVALGLIATVAGFNDGFLMIAAVLLAIDVFIGFASLGRIASASAEDIRFLQGMNRIRHAYVEMVPGTAPYFMSGHHDDPETVISMYGPVLTTPWRQMVHGFTTTPGMIGVITCAVAAALGAVLVMLTTHEPPLAGIVGVIAFIVLNAALIAMVSGNIRRFWSGMEMLFPRDTNKS
ncbi:MAG TPA: hypothetical protein VFI15_01880 [Candidatus Limnocylindrales bacterium]|nr:hypothetical protein [Candidatus Limnocylindrales bacterium]